MRVLMPTLLAAGGDGDADNVRLTDIEYDRLAIGIRAVDDEMFVDGYGRVNSASFKSAHIIVELVTCLKRNGDRQHVSLLDLNLDLTLDLTKVRSRLLLIFDQNQQCANAPWQYPLIYVGVLHKFMSFMICVWVVQYQCC